MEHRKKDLELKTEPSNFNCNHDSESLRGVWPFLQVSRILGLFPISKKGNRLEVPTSICDFYWIPTILGLVFQLLNLVNTGKFTIVQIMNGSVGNLVENFNNLMFYVQNVTVYLFIIHRVKDIPELLAAFAKVENQCRKYESNGSGLVRQVWLLFAFFFLAQLFELVLYYYSFGKLISVVQYILYLI